MTSPAKTRSISIFLAAAASLPAASHAFAAAHATAHATKAKTKKYKGPLVDMRWGPVQAIITVKKKKITDVVINVSPETRRSQFIDDQAVPFLRQETLDAQSASIDEVSGATDTSDAYMQSLQSAIKSAKKHKDL